MGSSSLSLSPFYGQSKLQATRKLLEFRSSIVSMGFSHDSVCALRGARSQQELLVLWIVLGQRLVWTGERANGLDVLP